MPFRQLTYLPDRRSTRIEQSVHAVVRGLDASRVPYQEKVSTLSVSCHGCRYMSRNNVLRGDSAILEVVQSGGGAKLPVEVRVASVKRVGAEEMLFDVAVELMSPQDIWDVAYPPEDWSEFSTMMGSVEAPRELRIVPRPDAATLAAPRRLPLEPIGPSPRLESGSTSSLPPLLVHLVASMREQVGSEFARGERAPLLEITQESLERLCAQIESEATKVLESLVATFVEELTRRAQELSEDHEAAARNTYERWLRRFEQEVANGNRRLA